MSLHIVDELAQIRARMSEVWNEIQDSHWDSAVVKTAFPELLALDKRRQQLWDSQEAKDLGVKGVGHDNI